MDSSESDDEFPFAEAASMEAAACAAGRPQAAQPKVTKKWETTDLSNRPLRPPVPLLGGLRGGTGCVLRASYNVPANRVHELDLAKLTLRPVVKTNIPGVEPPTYPVFTCRSVGGVPYVSVPRFYGLAAFGEPSKSMVAYGAPSDVAFEASLRPYQREAVSVVVRALTRPHTAAHGCMLEAACGAGKTICALAIMSRMRQRTAVLVHKSFLLTQWRERIAQFLPTARVGVCQGPTCEVENTDIVLVMIQSVCQGKYPPATFDSVGLLIVDECHHLAARYFQTSMRYFSADARLGLTATANRADGLGFALHYFLGPTVYRIRRGGPEVGSGSTKVRVVRYRGGTRKEIRTRGRPDFTRMVTRQVQDDERNAAIAQIVDALLREGRRVIVMSARRNHLESLRELIGEDRSCLYMGETSKKRKRARDEAAKTSPCLLSTYSMGEEGLDIPALDTLVMVTPKSSLACIQQAVGRILREHPGKKSPLVVDFQDTYSVFHGMARKRRGWYESRKFRVTVEEVGGKSD